MVRKKTVSWGSGEIRVEREIVQKQGNWERKSCAGPGNSNNTPEKGFRMADVSQGILTGPLSKKKDSLGQRGGSQPKEDKDGHLQMGVARKGGSGSS